VAALAPVVFPAVFLAQVNNLMGIFLECFENVFVAGLTHFRTNVGFGNGRISDRDGRLRLLVRCTCSVFHLAGGW
jgi:hypothetical protein